MGEERLSAVHDLDRAQPAADPDLERIAQIAASIFSAPVAIIGLLDETSHIFKGAVGVQQDSSPVEISFCAHAIAKSTKGVAVVPDATRDPRFSTNPLVVSGPKLRFYAGTPLVVAGQPVGTLCVFDFVAREPDSGQLEQLERLGDLASSMLRFKEGSRAGAIARAALVREEKRHALALEASSIASWVWDLRTGLLECDDLLPQLFDLPAETRFQASRIFRAIDPRDVGSAEEHLREALRTGEDYSGVYRVRGVFPARWLAGRGRVVEWDMDGKPQLVFGVNFDITEQKLGEERQRLLLRELNHRVKNTLANVQALATQTVRHTNDPREFLKAFAGRLQALGAAHNLLSDREWRGVGLSELIEKQIRPYLDADSGQFLFGGEDVNLSPDQAVALGTILHELASNAVRYGSLSTEEGSVRLEWHVGRQHGAHTLTIRWTEEGGPEVSPPDRQGFGTILIRRSLGKVLGSKVSHEFRPEGVFCEIELPLADEVEETL